MSAISSLFGYSLTQIENKDEIGVKSEDSVNGGTDVLSSSADSESSADHLVVMVHGILGSTSDWQYGANQFVKALPEKVIVHCSERNMHGLTLDGIDVMGERLAEEVVEVISRRPGLKKISFIAHSLGGLVARYAIGRLYKPRDGDGASSAGTISDLEPMNFITVATPHLGSRQIPLLFGVTAMEKAAAYVMPWIFRRTGRHLFITDNDEGQIPLLKRMVDDHGDLYFMSALGAFKRRVVYANVGYDHIVGWTTSSIRRHSELPVWDASISDKYPHVVHEEYSKGFRVDNHGLNSESTEHSVDSDVTEEELVKALSRLSWEKVDVSFHSSSLQKYAAHSVIQVKYPSLYSEGADVIQHMIDHFLV